MQNIFTNIKCSEIIVYNANENWYIILYDLFSRLCYIATCGPFCKDDTHIYIRNKNGPKSDSWWHSHYYWLRFGEALILF